MHPHSGRPIVIKIGGSTLDEPATTLEDVVSLQKRGITPIIVHGGGQIISQWQNRLGIATRFVNGLRVTDDSTLEVVIAILAGLINKQLVAIIESLGGQAMGLSGIDGRLIEAQVKDKNLGYAGDIIKINPEPLISIVANGYIPIIAPVSLRVSSGEEEGEMFLNVNGDSAAGEIATAINAERLIFLTDIIGICDASGKLIPHLTPGEAGSLVASGIISEGMIPKVEACMRAHSTVAITRIINGRIPHALLAEIENRGEGTTIA